MATVILKQTALAGKSLTLYLRSMSSGVVVNTGGDSCSEGTTGHFSATVGETLTGLHEASFLNGAGATQYGGWTKEQLPAVTPKMVAEAAGWSEEIANPETPGQFAIRVGINLWAQLVDQARQQELQEIMQATHAAQSAQQDPLSKFEFQSQQQ